MKRIDILTLFPDIFRGFLEDSVIVKMTSKGIGRINITDIRSFTHDRHHAVDDYPYGGGAGMVLMAPPIFEAVEFLRRENPQSEVILLSPQGRVFTQEVAIELAKKEGMILICGRYEGFDERIRSLVTDEISIGDYVLTNGELAGMVVVNAVVRLYKGVLGNEQSAVHDSFCDSGLLDHPHYTRPYEYRGMKVPDVLLSGHHEKIRIWRRKKSLRRTLQRRPDLLKKSALTEEDKILLKEIQQEKSR